MLRISSLKYSKQTINSYLLKQQQRIILNKHIHTSIPVLQKSIKDQIKDLSSSLNNESVSQQGGGHGASASDYFVNVLDRGPNVGIEVITKNGFVLSNNVQISDPLILVNGSPFLWKIPPDYVRAPQWDMEPLSIFDLVSPKPELIIFGTGSTFSPLPDHVRRHFHQLGVQVDIMNTKHAAATYNVLAEEGRRVAAALLPTNN